MPITQFGAYRLKNNIAFQSEQLQTYLRLLSSQQEAASGNPLMIYTDDRDPTVFYLLSGWKDTTTHMNWALDDANKDLLNRGMEMVTVELGVHIGLDISDIPRDTGVLTYMKIEGKAWEAQGAPGQLWVGHGPDLEKPRDIYQFAAFDAVKRTSGIPDECVIMDRVLL